MNKSSAGIKCGCTMYLQLVMVSCTKATPSPILEVALMHNFETHFPTSVVSIIFEEVKFLVVMRKSVFTAVHVFPHRNVLRREGAYSDRYCNKR